MNLYTAHGFYFHDAQPRWLRELTVLVEAVLARVTYFTLSQSAEDVEFMVRRGIIARERIAHIGNGIDVERFSPQFDRLESENRLGLDHCPFRIATTGRIVKGKGFEDLLVAFDRFADHMPKSQLVIIGGNISQDIEPFQNEFAARIDSLGLSERVRITGIVENVEEYLAASDLFVLPSYREGMPRSLIEAMSMGLPCIATDIRGCREVVSDGITGFIYPPGDVDALVTLMKRCFSNRAELATVASRARMAVVRDFTENAYLARQVAAIERLLVKFAGAQ